MSFFFRLGDQGDDQNAVDKSGHAPLYDAADRSLLETRLVFAVGLPCVSLC